MMSTSSANEGSQLARRFLIHASTGRDSELASRVLTSAGIFCEICHSAASLRVELARGAGGVLTVEEALVDEILAVLGAYVEKEPDWSDLPILVMAGQGEDSVPIQQAVRLLRNMVLLDRPVRTASLISTARSALLARERQYQVCEAQERLRESEQRFKSMFDNHPDGAFTRDLQGNLISTNAAHEALLGYSLEELQALSLEEYLAPEGLEQARYCFQEATRGTAQKFSTQGIRKDGARVDIDIVCFPVVVREEIVGVHGIARDVTQANKNERHIEFLATHDVLTGLSNRTVLDDRLHHALEQAKRSRRQTGVLFLDLNRFKQVNDSLGHEKGDQLLKIIASRLKETVRDADTVARLGGDEFVIVLEDLSAREDMRAIAESLIEAVEQPVRLDSHEVSVSTSIGGSVFPDDTHDAAILLKYADMAMYRAKESGAGCFCYFDKRMNQHVLTRLLTENALRLALQNDEFEVHYQPRINIKERRIVGVEALVRWNRPDKGMMLPAEFIPLAEEIGLIDQIGEWVLRTACRQARLWQQQGLPALRTSVNISAYQLSSASLGDQVQHILEQEGLDASCLELEITETSLMKNLDLSCELLGRLRTHGVRISMDDFGTGYSSLAHIKRLPVDTLKIDQSFIRNLTEDPDDAAIVSATIALARHMGLSVVAEGVTVREQVDFLAERDCYEMQGYLFGRPRPAEQITALLGSTAALTLDLAG